MSVLSDKWIRKMSKEEEMISPFEENKLEEITFLMDYPLLVMMLVFLMNLKFLPM